MLVRDTKHLICGAPTDANHFRLEALRDFVTVTPERSMPG